VTWVIQYQNVSILDFIGVKDDRGGRNRWSYKDMQNFSQTVPPTNQHQALQVRCPSCRPTNTFKALKGKQKEKVEHRKQPMQ